MASPQPKNDDAALLSLIKSILDAEIDWPLIADEYKGALLIIKDNRLPVDPTERTDAILNDAVVLSTIKPTVGSIKVRNLRGTKSMRELQQGDPAELPPCQFTAMHANQTSKRLADYSDLQFLTFLAKEKPELCQPYAQAALQLGRTSEGKDVITRIGTSLLATRDYDRDDEFATQGMKEVYQSINRLKGAQKKAGEKYFKTYSIIYDDLGHAMDDNTQSLVAMHSVNMALGIAMPQANRSLIAKILYLMEVETALKSAPPKRKLAATIMQKLKEHCAVDKKEGYWDFLRLSSGGVNKSATDKMPSNKYLEMLDAALETAAALTEANDALEVQVDKVIERYERIHGSIALPKKGKDII